MESVARRLSYWGYKQEGVSGGKDRKEQSWQLALLNARNQCPDQNGKKCSVCISGSPTHTKVSMPAFVPPSSPRKHLPPQHIATGTEK